MRDNLIFFPARRRAAPAAPLTLRAAAILALTAALCLGVCHLADALTAVSLSEGPVRLASLSAF
jgi:hypothetical protein